MDRNVHAREIAAPADAVGALLDALGGPDDELWPAPPWPALRLDRPVQVGATGGHGPIRYAVTAHEPGRRVEFTFDPRIGLHGTHTFEVVPLGPDRCRLSHTLRGHPRSAARLTWPLAIRWLHDALLEDLLDRAEAAVGTPPRRPRAWSSWVATIVAAGAVPAAACEVPTTELLAGALPRVDAADAYAVPAAGTSEDPQVWAEAVFSDPPGWVSTLLAVRQGLVGLVGIERGDVSSFATVARTADEVLLGTDAGHLDFRASILRRDRTVVLTTVVHLHSVRGRLYWAVVRHVHPVVVASMLARAARRLAVPPTTADAPAPALTPGRGPGTPARS